MSINNVRKGSERDKAILRSIERMGALTTKQIAALHFDIESGYDKANQRLKKLYDDKQIKRCKTNNSYCYYQGQRSGRLEHLLSLNWVLIHTLKQLRSWQTLYRWEYEKDYKFLRADAFLGLSNSFSKTVNYSFIELDRSNNTFDKIEKYNRLFESNVWESENWVKTADKFPEILCVCEDRSRCRLILDLIEKENENDLVFKVYYLDDLIREVTRWKN